MRCSHEGWMQNPHDYTGAPHHALYAVHLLHVVTVMAVMLVGTYMSCGAVGQDGLVYSIYLFFGHVAGICMGCDH